MDTEEPTLDNAAVRRIDLAAVEATLRRLQRGFDRALLSMSAVRDPLDDHVLENMVAGYAFIDALVANRIDVLAPGNLKHVLEMNNLVLCGTRPAHRDDYRGHIEATERRFYEEREGGIQDLVEWCADHKDDTVWDLAAGAYVRMLSKPQLFIEGNHRTGALFMSFVLVRNGEPPFVLSPDAVAAYFDPSTAVRDINKNSPAMRFHLSRIREQMVRLLVQHSNPRHLLP